MGGSCGDDGSAIKVRVLGMGVSICPVVISSGATVYSAGGMSWDGSVDPDGPGISCSGGDRYPNVVVSA